MIDPDEISRENGETVYCTHQHQTSQYRRPPYNDLNGSGDWDDNEPYLDGWTINLLDSDHQFIASIETGAGSLSQGEYKFENLLPGTYSICETLTGNGWIQTDPSTGYGVQWAHCRTKDSFRRGNITDADFGNRGNLSITACKYGTAMGRRTAESSHQSMVGLYSRKSNPRHG